MKNNSFQYTGQVLSDWIYENGHMNVKSYVGLFESVMWSKWKISSENSDPMALLAWLQDGSMLNPVKDFSKATNGEFGDELFR